MLGKRRTGPDDPWLASSHFVNWVSPSGFKALNEAGYRGITLDHRVHVGSIKSYDEADYTPNKMAGDRVVLLDHLGIESEHVMCYSMGTRVLEAPERGVTLVFVGFGLGMVEGFGNWDPIAVALLAEDHAKIMQPRAKMLRFFR